VSKQDEGAIWWPERGYFTATPEQLERLISLGKHQERERIIKVAQEAAFTEVNIGTSKEPNIIKVHCDAVRLPLFIELIKGEQK